MAIDTKKISIGEAHELLVKKELSVRELADTVLEKAKETESLKGYIELYDDIDVQVKTAQEKIDNGQASLLTGIPLALKDNILRNGFLATAASKILSGYKASYDSTVVAVLKKENPLFMGRTNMDEFAMGGSTERSCYGPSKNPYDEKRVPGGSSGGSAVVVATGAALASLGSDTGGSIRQPASFTGLVGLKPTYGTVSRFGLMAMGSSLDQIGPFTKNVADSRIMYNAIATDDNAHDNTSVPQAKRIFTKTKNKKVAVPKDIINSEGIDPEVKKNFEETLTRLTKEGYEIVECDLPYLSYSLAAYYIVMPAESSTNLARFDGVRFGYKEDGHDIKNLYEKTRGHGFGEEVRRRIILGNFVLSHGYYDAFYNKAEQFRAALRDEINKVFAYADVLATPTSPTPAFLIGEKTNDPLSMYLADIFTVPANLTGMPAISVPSGKTTSGLPLGFHMTAPHFGESVLFEIGTIVERP